MAHLVFFADPRDLIELEPGESPRDAFVCMLGQGIHIDARAQLYSIITGKFLQDALEMEEPVDDQATEATWIGRLHSELVACIGKLDEQAIIETVGHWMSCEEIESLDVGQDDLLDYLFALVNLCQNCLQEDAGVYAFTSV